MGRVLGRVARGAGCGRRHGAALVVVGDRENALLDRRAVGRATNLVDRLSADEINRRLGPAEGLSPGLTVLPFLQT